MICLIRHGEPSASWGAHPDPGLTELGQKQAEAAAQVLSGFPLTRIVTSPLARCRATAKPFEKLMETHARIEPAVGEIVTPPDTEDRPAWLRAVMEGSWSAQPGYDGWRQGVLAAIETCPDNTAVFSHFVAINALVGLLTGDDRVVVFRPGHCSITRLERRGGRLAIAELGAEGALQVL